VVFDFDGTLCLGDDPVLIYAQLVDEALAEHHGADNGHQLVRRNDQGFSIRKAVHRGLDAGNLLVPEIVLDNTGYPADIEGKTDMVLWPLQDGYQLVQLLGLQAGLDSTETHAAFRESRARLLRQGLALTDVHAPTGVVEVISRLRQQQTAVVLITNSPAENFDRWLTQLGLSDHFDLIINSAKKPTGMPEAVDQAREAFAANGAPIAMEAVVSVGDIWGNDLAYVHDQGGQTILIDRFDTGLGNPDHRVPDAASALLHLDHQKVSNR
jgi:FMN phosphatase YigB (HAD superfamily)